MIARERHSRSSLQIKSDFIVRATETLGRVKESGPFFLGTGPTGSSFLPGSSRLPPSLQFVKEVLFHANLGLEEAAKLEPALDSTGQTGLAKKQQVWKGNGKWMGLANLSSHWDQEEG